MFQNLSWSGVYLGINFQMLFFRSHQSKLSIWVYVRVFDPFLSIILQINKRVCYIATTQNPYVANPFGRVVDVKFHCRYEVISKFVWSALILGWTHILGCKIMHWCPQVLYVDILGCLEFLFQLTIYGKNNCRRKIRGKKSYGTIGDLNIWSTWLPPYFRSISRTSSHWRDLLRVALCWSF